MNIIQQYLAELSPANARSVCYYLSRHLKQAAIFNDYSKDPFIDADSSIPDPEVRAKTEELLIAIEKSESMTADKFDDITYSRWMDSLLTFERGLSSNSEPTARVQEFLKRGA